MKLPTLYFNWLQKDNPVGGVDRFPELRNGFETSVPGLYCIGDLTGVPLIKLAAESGHELMLRLSADEQFKKERLNIKGQDVYDLVIAGAGPSGVSAGLDAQALGYRYMLIESTRKFNTIVNFPPAKLIYVTPVDPPMKSALKFSDGTKETLLEELRRYTEGRSLQIREGETVLRIIREPDYFIVETDKGSYKSLRVIVAIGKTGNARKLEVPGEKLPKVFTRLIDPGEYSGRDILVVGGGNSAVEAAAALAKAGNRVTLSYRKEALARPGERAIVDFEFQVRNGSIIPLFESTVREIREADVILNTKEGEKIIPNQVVFVLIGTEIPVEFFKRSNIRVLGEKTFVDRVKFAALLLFAALLYFGKKAPVTVVSDWGEFLRVPVQLVEKSRHGMIEGLFAWVALLGLGICGAYIGGHFVRNARRYCTSAWNSFKYGYFLAMAVLISCMYVAYKLLGLKPFLFDSEGWYAVLYSLTIVVFGLRRIYVRPTGYIARQTAALMAFQVLLLFVIPMLVIPYMGKQGMLSDWIMTNVFPGGSYWRSFGFVLAWPLFMYNLAMGQPTAFWLILGVIQTFVIIPAIVYRWGKGAYCGWVCSCGALAETLGDEYRAKAPHGPGPKRAENSGQMVLWFAVCVTIGSLISGSGHSAAASTALEIYAFCVDIVCAGVIGLGCYFFLSGRVWCRFLCPLAALMHLYARFSVYRIFSNKKRCISCNICTRVCHMGIDVMNYANRGIPMNDVQCVRCSACVVSCPMQVLTFGKTGGTVPDKSLPGRSPVPLTRGWASGLFQKDIAMLLKEEGGTKNTDTVQ